MYNKARQWPSKMTAGLLPAQLVHNYQLRQLFLLFSIKKDLFEGIIEPLMSPTVWKNGMDNIKQVAWEKHVWPISGLASVVIKYNLEQKEIQVVVAFRADAKEIGESNRAIASVVCLANVVNSPQLKYTFSEDETGSRSFSKTTGG